MVFDSSKFYFSPSCDDAIVLDEHSVFADWTDSELTELFEERAAIGQHDGKLPRQAAEATALEWVKSEIGESRYKVWGSKPNNVQSKKVVADPARPATVLPNYEGVE